MSNRDNNISVRESLIEREKEIVRVKLVSERERKKVGANFEKESRGKERAAKLLIPLSLSLILTPSFSYQLPQRVYQYSCVLFY